MKPHKFKYISDPEEIQKITHFSGITRGRDDLPDALLRADTVHGVLAVQCPWKVYRRLRGAKEAAGHVAWDDAEAQYREAMKASGGLLGWLSPWFSSCFEY